MAVERGVRVRLAVVTLAQVQDETYQRYYALLVLGDVEPEFDPIPDR